MVRVQLTQRVVQQPGHHWPLSANTYCCQHYFSSLSQQSTVSAVHADTEEGPALPAQGPSTACLGAQHCSWAEHCSGPNTGTAQGPSTAQGPALIRRSRLLPSQHYFLQTLITCAVRPALAAVHGLPLASSAAPPLLPPAIHILVSQIVLALMALIRQLSFMPLLARSAILQRPD